MKPLYKPGLGFYVEKLQRGEPFSFVRYGDGEWNYLLDREKYVDSKDLQRYVSELHAALTASILEPRMENYYLALQNHGYLGPRGYIPRIDQWLKEHKAPKINWHFGTVFHRASGSGQLWPLIKALQIRPLVMVGPEWLRKLTFAMKLTSIPPKHCWSSAELVETQLQNVASGSVVSFSAGPMAKVLIHRLAPILGQHSWLIDFGSLWDPYCGVKSRQYHKIMSAKTIRRNLGM